MIRRLFSVFLAFLLVCGAAVQATATDATEASTEAPANVPRDPGQCGEEMVWAYKDGVLTITGRGEMDDFPEGAPWEAYKDQITEVILEGGVTYIGAGAFRDYDALETVDFGDTLREIGAEAFRSCEGLTEIELPATFKIFGESSFLSCNKLEKIHCSGGFPSFRLNSMWDCYATIYYPVERPWAESLIEELETAFHDRINFLASDGSDPYAPTEAETEPEETEAPTTEAPTEAPTEETTVPTTEATQPPTEETVPETTAASVTEAPTEATAAPTVPEEPGETDNGMLVLLAGLCVAVVLTLVIGLVMVLRQIRKKGKYSM